MRVLGDVPRVVPAEQRKPIWLYPNLLSLDAPLVALSWLYVFAVTWRLYVPWETYATLGLVVWVIYVADRLLDVSLAGPSARLEVRHRFHNKHRKFFRIAASVAFVMALVLMVTRMPMTIYSHLLLGGVMVAGFFGLAMLSSQDADEIPHTKNILAGITFAFGTAMTAHMYRYEYGFAEMFFSSEFVCFAVLCILNISAIHLWEHAARSRDVETKASDELTLTLPLILLAAASLMYAVFDEEQSSRPFFYSTFTASALLYILNRSRSRFSIDTLRVLADAALVFAVLVFYAAAHG